MMTLTVEIDKERDLPVLQALLNRLELKYHIDNENYQLTDAELNSINLGLEDIKAGRVHTATQAKARIDQKINKLRNNNA